MIYLLLLQGKHSSLSEIDIWVEGDLRNEKAWYPERIIVARIFITLLIFEALSEQLLEMFLEPLRLPLKIMGRICLFIWEMF